MGQIIIKTPLHFDRNYRIISHDSAEDILSKLEDLIKKSNSVDKEEIFHLWSDREESAFEIAQKTRDSWKRKI